MYSLWLTVSENKVSYLNESSWRHSHV